MENGSKLGIIKPAVAHPGSSNDSRSGGIERVQEVEPANDESPAGHATQDSAPRVVEKDLGGHISHGVAELASPSYCPGSQDAQRVAPQDAKLPTPHAAHLVEPEPDSNRPTGHSAHPGAPPHQHSRL